MSLKRWIFLGAAISIATILLIAVLTPSLRARIQGYLSKPGREVLATAEGDLLNNGSRTKAVKYRTQEGIYVEVVQLENDGSTRPVDRILLPDKHDGLFNFQGHVTRLAITDVNNDGTLELLAPTFDQQLVPHLNVFRYNSDVGRFEPVQPE